ncbi:MAG: hypothetical protein PHV23_04380 [Candidatus Gracilibacteria bacterium]|nr:hypothetical protein [Candidatus Gracilibacteria bacterium]
MNKFDQNFFSKYVPEGQELITIIHTHPVNILRGLLVKIALLVILPSVFYYYSISIQTVLPFYVLEIYLFVIYVKIIYDIFNWYNDVWLITNQSIVWVERSFLKVHSDSVNYENIEGVGVEQTGIIDKILSKGDLIVHKIGDESFALKDAINPYKAIDLIENARNNEDEEIENDKFDIIMDALSGVVGNYLDKGKEKSKKQELLEEKIKHIEKEIGTIDLR